MAALNSVRIRLRYPDLDTFVEKFAPNVTRGGIFLASRNVQPVGSTISFEIQLVNGDVALAGQGKVTWTKEFNAAEPSRPYGMGVQFTSVDPATRPTLARVLRARETGGIVPRRATNPFAPLGDAASRTMPGFGLANGRHAAPMVDTTVDLVAEFGLDDATIRRVIDRTWVSLSGARGVEDLTDLLKNEPAETATLAQALAELPRLLDPSLSRRRASGGFRATDVGAPAQLASGGSGPVVASAADPAEITQQTDAAVAVAAHESQGASEDTDMTGAAVPEDMNGSGGVTAEAGAGGAHGHGDRRRKHRRRR